MQSWMQSKGTGQDAEQGVGLNADLFLANSKSLTITQCCVDVSNYAANKNIKWAATPPLDGNTQIVKVKSSCN